MKKSNKRGMSIAGVLGIMVCLVSIVSMIFVLAVRSSVLTSRSLKYIESYNDASSSIDNAVDFMVNEANANGVSITGNFVHSKCDAMEMLFGVTTSTTVAKGNATIDMVNEGFIVEIKKEYYSVGNEVSYLRSVVEFSASLTGGAPQIITPDLAIDKEVEITDKSQLTQAKYNPVNLLWNYWADQFDSTEDGDTTKNNLVNIFTKYDNFQGTLEQQLTYFEALYPYLSNYDVIDGVQYITLDGEKMTLNNALYKLGLGNMVGNVQRFDAASFVEAAKNAFLGFLDITDSNWQPLYPTFNDPSSTAWYNNSSYNFEENYGKDTDADGIIDTYVIDETCKILDLKLINNSYTRIKNIYITDNSLVYVNNGIELACNLYIERGSTIFTGGSFKMTEYKSDEGGLVAPILDADYVSNDSLETAEYIGGGLLVRGDLAYEATDGSGVLVSESRYDYRKNIKTLLKSYINGGFTVGGKCKMTFYKEDKESTTKLSAGATIYSTNEMTISNLGFASSDSGIRPFLAFVDASVTMKYCCSMVGGAPLLYNDNYEEFENENNIGFAIITCTKVKDIADVVGGRYLMMLNMFHNNTGEAENDDDLLKVSQTWQQQSGAYGFNTFVSDKVLQKCSNDIERDSLYWYIPDKLRGSFIQAAISGTQANSSKN